MRTTATNRCHWQGRSIKLLCFLAPQLTGAAIGAVTLYQLSDGAHVIDWVLIALTATVGFAACGACGRLRRRWQQGHD